MIIKKQNQMEKNYIQYYKRNGKKTDNYDFLNQVVSEDCKLIEKSKDECHYHLGKQLNGSSTVVKSYWTTLKSLYNLIKIRFILPLLANNISTIFKEKANLSIGFFSKQCTPIANDSLLPPLLEIPNETLSSLEIINSDISKLIKALHVNKAHGHDEISVKLCKSVISEPLYFIFKNCINSNTFLNVWKKTNVIPVHKKGDKQMLKNYCPVSFLSVRSKIFEKLIFNALYSFFEEYNLPNPCQSRFKKNGFCINQVVSITNET